MQNIDKILELVAKGISVATALLQAAEDATPALKALADLISGARKGEVTDEELTSTEALLDGLIADFNIPMADA